MDPLTRSGNDNDITKKTRGGPETWGAEFKTNMHVVFAEWRDTNASVKNILRAVHRRRRGRAKKFVIENELQEDDAVGGNERGKEDSLT